MPKVVKRIPKYKEIAPEVARLRDIERLSFDEIARRLNMKIKVIYQAYEYAHPGDCPNIDRRAARNLSRSKTQATPPRPSE